MPENIKNKRTVKTILQGSTTIKRAADEYCKQKYLGRIKIKVLLESITDIFKVLSEYNNKKIAREYIIQSTARKCHKQVKVYGRLVVLCVHKLFTRKYLLMFW